LPGESDEIILISAHHDSVVTPGAIDDASGVAVVLEIARVLAGEQLHRTIVFAIFGAEEVGLLGSTDFVSRHEDLPICAVINFDCIGDGPDDGLRVGLEGPYATTGWLDAYVRKVARENLGLEAPPERYEILRGISDHLSFTRAGIAATWIYWITADDRGILYPIHTPGDNLDAVSKERLWQVATLGVTLVHRLAAEDIDKWIWMYELPIKQAIFAMINLCAVVISIGLCCFVRYRRGWMWRRAALTFTFVVCVTAIVTYLKLLVYEFGF
jgi:aminopeptidase YwaD